MKNLDCLKKLTLLEKLEILKIRLKSIDML